MESNLTLQELNVLICWAWLQMYWNANICTVTRRCLAKILSWSFFFFVRWLTWWRLLTLRKRFLDFACLPDSSFPLPVVSPTSYPLYGFESPWKYHLFTSGKFIIPVLSLNSHNDSDHKNNTDILRRRKSTLKPDLSFYDGGRGLNSLLIKWRRLTLRVNTSCTSVQRERSSSLMPWLSDWKKWWNIMGCSSGSPMFMCCVTLWILPSLGR